MATPLRVYRAASTRFAIGNVVMAAGFAISLFRTDDSSVTFWLINDLFLVAGFLYYRLATYQLFQMPNNGLFDKAAIVAIGLLLLCALMFSPSIEALSIGTTIICVTALTLTAMAKYRGLRNEMGLLPAVSFIFPAVVICTILVLKGLLIALYPDTAEIWFIRPQVDSEPLLWAYLVALVTANAASFGAALTKLILKIRKLAEHDQLTGLYNRRAIKLRLAQAYKLYKRSNVPFSVMLVDVDHFKRINDEYGHDAGDEAIKFVGQTMHDSLRETDIICRYGGEEFLILMSGSTRRDGIPAAEKLRINIASRPLHWNKHNIDLKVSIGCASIDDHDSIQSMLRAADNALYVAKSKGRNCVEPSIPASQEPIATSS